MKKKIVVTAVQILTTAFVLWLLFRDPEQRARMAEALRTANPLWLLAGFLLYGLVEIGAIVRWQIFLRVQDVRIGWGRASMLYMIGLFFNILIPGAVGGDVVKIFYLLKEVGPSKKAAAILSAIIDRLVGLLALIVVALAVIVWRYDWLTQTPMTRNLLYGLVLFLSVGLTAIGFSFVITGFGLAHKLPARMPFRDRFIELAAAYNVYGRAWKSSLAGLLISVPVHLCTFGTFWCAARAMASSARIGDIFAVMPIVAVVASLPISLSGVGTREWVFQQLLGDLAGVDPAKAVLISLSAFMMMVCWCLIGGIIYFFYRPTEHAKLREIDKTVHEFEHEIAQIEEKAGKERAS